MSMMEKQLIPAGYKQTEVGVIPEDWDVEQLESLVAFNNGAAHENDINEFGKYVVVNSKFISTEGRVAKYSDKCLSATKTGNILMVMSDVPNGKAIAKCFSVDNDDKYTVNQRICSIEPKTIESKFLFYILNRNKYYLQFDDGAKQTNLRRQDVLSCPVLVPPPQEQTAIANALSDVDALIAALEKLINKKSAIKTAAMQQLLTGKKRLPPFDQLNTGYKHTELGEIPGGWAVVELGDLGQFKNGINKDAASFGHGTPFVNLMDVFGKPSIDDFKELGLIDATENDLKEYDLKSGDVLFIRSSVKPSGVGLTSVVKNNLDKTVYSGFLIRFRSNEKLETLFKEHCFYQSDFRKRIIAASSVSANTNINQDNLKKIPLVVPPKEEQTAIANVLSDMDKDLEALQQRLHKTQQIKQGMMQELLTGKTRLI